MECTIQKYPEFNSTTTSYTSSSVSDIFCGLKKFQNGQQAANAIWIRKDVDDDDIEYLSAWSI